MKLLLLILVAAGAALRLYRLDTGLWFDEIVTLITSVRPPLSEIVTSFPGNNNHPLYSVFAHLSVTLLGEHPWTVRLPSALFGVASLPALYLVGTTVASRFESALAVTILTVSYHHVWFSQNARGYTLLLLCVLLATYLLLKWLAGGSGWHLAAYAVVGALGAYTHLTMVFVVVTHAAVVALELWRREWRSAGSRTRWRPAIAAFGGAALLTILLYAPMLGGVQTFFTTQTVTSNEVATPVWALAAALRGLQIGFGSLWAIAAGLLVFGAGAWSYFRRHDVALCLFLLPIPVTLALAVAMARPIFPRFVFFAIGFVLLITVRGAAVLGGWLADRAVRGVRPEQLGRAAALALTAAAVVFSIRSLPYGYRYPKQDYARAVAFIEQHRRETDPAAVVGVTGSIPVREYLGREWPRIDRADDLRALQREGRDVWVLFTFPAYIESGQPELWAMLRAACVPVADFHGTVAAGGITVSRCARTGG
jgi:uncharacterized membrane protein